MANYTFEPLINVVDVNHWKIATQWTVYQQNSYTIFFQLQNAEIPVGYTQDFSSQPQNPLFLRHIPAASSTLNVTINDLNSDYVVTAICSQPFSNDLSIWSFNLSASQTSTMSGGNILAAFYDANTSTTNNFQVNNVLKVIPFNRSSC